MSSKKILLIEDDETIRFAVKVFLEDHGYLVSEAENGSEALQIIKEQGLPNLVLTDMVMPVMNGWQFSEKFKILYDHLVPIIVMTAAADAERHSRAVCQIVLFEG